MDPEIVEMVPFLDPEIVEKVDKSFMEAKLLHISSIYQLYLRQI